MIKRTFYYLLAAGIGLCFGFFTIGAGGHRAYFYEGKRISLGDMSTDFIAHHVADIKSVTIIRYNDVFQSLTSYKSQILPTFWINGDFGTPNNAYHWLIAINIAAAVIFLWVIRALYFKLKRPKGSEASANSL